MRVGLAGAGYAAGVESSGQHTLDLVRGVVTLSLGLVLLWQVRRHTGRISSLVWAIVLLLAVRGATRIATELMEIPRWLEAASDVFGLAAMVFILFQAGKLARGLLAAQDRTYALEAKLAAVVQGSDDAIISASSDGRIESWNPGAHKLFGFSAEEAIGQPLSIMVPPERQGEERQLLARVLEGESVDHFETERIRKDQTRLMVSLSASPIRDAAGRITGAAAISRDVTAQHQAASEQLRYAEGLEQVNRELQRADEMKNHFLAMASHELRTPLTSIGGFASTMTHMWDTLPDEEKLRFVTIIEEQGVRLSRLVDDLLTLSHIEAGSFTARATATEVRTAMEQAVEELGASRVVDVSCSDDLAVLTDVDHLKQVIVNLVANAMKYGSHPIRVTGGAEGEWGQITVTDEGAGVSEEFAPHLFEKFARDQRTALAQKGTGLGLSIVQGLVRTYRGEVWYEPNSPSGAAFHVRLPRAPQPG